MEGLEILIFSLCGGNGLCKQAASGEHKLIADSRISPYIDSFELLILDILCVIL